MTDYFALLEEPRQPWIDPDGLKDKFLSASAGLHPDRAHAGSEADQRSANRNFTELNTAYQCLREPKARLRHLLELERGKKPAEIEEIPSGVMDLFMEVGQLCRKADAFLAEKDRVTSPLLRVQLFERGQEWSDQLSALQQRISARQDDLNAELKALNADWQRVGKTHPILVRLEEIYRWFSYLNRWTQQLQERIVRLAL